MKLLNLLCAAQIVRQARLNRSSNIQHVILGILNLAAVAMVLLAELSGRYIFKQSQSFLASFYFGVAARRCHSLTNDGVMYDYSSKDTGWGSVDSREFTCFEAVVGTSIFICESVVQIRL